MNAIEKRKPGEILEEREDGFCKIDEQGFPIFIPKQFTGDIDELLIKKGLPSKRVKEFYEQGGFLKGDCLILSGDTGLGKTCATILFLKNYVAKKGKAFIYYYSSRLFNRIRYAEDKAALIQEICETPLLIIDDLGTQKDTNFSESVLDEIINEREGNGRATIITTNKSQKNFKTIFGERVSDRLNAWAITSTLIGKSMRSE
jgi:DNA replication protein DnaC